MTWILWKCLDSMIDMQIHPITLDLHRVGIANANTGGEGVRDFLTSAIVNIETGHRPRPVNPPLAKTAA